jgi:G patch domain/KOW motif-containing protein
MPIEEFGLAMLRGMGWQEGMGVGRNRKVVDAIEYLKVWTEVWRMCGVALY